MGLSISIFPRPEIFEHEKLTLKAANWWSIKCFIKKTHPSLNTTYCSGILPHYCIFRTFKLFEPWWTTVFSTQLATNIIDIALALYTLTEVS